MTPAADDFANALKAAEITTAGDFMHKVGISNWMAAKKWMQGEYAPNHPWIPKIAKAINLPAATLVARATLPILGSQHVARLEKWLKEGGPPKHPNGKQGKPVKSKNGATKRLKAKATVKANGKPNGTHSPLKLRALKAMGRGAELPAAIPKPKRIGTPTRRKVRAYVAQAGVSRKNALLRKETPLRQAVRGVTEAVNFAIMRGHEDLDPIPTASMALIMDDYFKRVGIEGLILSPDFTERFDR